MQPAEESDEEGNSFDRNDVMSEEEALADGLIDISDDGNSVENEDKVSQRGNKRKKGMKVGPRVAVQSSGKAKSKVWDHFEKVPVPSKTEPGVETIMAQCNYCHKFFSYNLSNGGATSHLMRH